MKELLEIRAINIENHIGGFPKNMTLHMFERADEQKILDILNKCGDSGFMKIEEEDKLKEFFQVKQILYRGVDWDRFENYDAEGHQDGTHFNTYIMSFDRFQKLKRPKKIYIDFYNSISLTD
jgi:hypothetical protein